MSRCQGMISVALRVMTLSLVALLIFACSSDADNPTDATSSVIVAQVGTPTVQPTARPTNLPATPATASSPIPSSTQTVEPTANHTTTKENEVAHVPAVTPLNGAVNVRAEPGTSTEIVGILPFGQTAVILEQNEAGSWYRVETEDGRKGWVGSSVVRQVMMIELTTAVPVVIAEESSRPAAAEVTPTPGSDPSLRCITQEEVDDDGERYYSLLEIVEVKYQDRLVHIEGCTDLPDGTALNVTLDSTNYSPDGLDSYVGVSVNTEVEDGAFSAEIAPPNIPQYETGPYAIEVRMRVGSRTQNDSILDLLGENGEQLRGDRLWEYNEVRYGMVVTDTVDLSLVIQPPEYPQIDASAYTPGSPERTMAEFLLAWQREDWSAMASLSQLTWLDIVDDPLLDLEAYFGFRRLLGAEFTLSPPYSREEQAELYSLFALLSEAGEDREVILTEDVYTGYDVTLYYALNPTWIRKSSVQAVLIKEDEPFGLSMDGVWGVNPDSLLGDEVIEDSVP